MATWQCVHAVIQFKKSGRWYVFEFPIKTGRTLDSVEDELHKWVKRAHQMEMAWVDSFFRILPLQTYWIHFVDVEQNLFVSKKSIQPNAFSDGHNGSEDRNTFVWV
jgi:hypothetical protein